MTARPTRQEFPQFRFVIAAAATPWLVCCSFGLLAQHVDGQKATTLLPFDAPATYCDAYLSSVALVVLLCCVCRAAGLTRWWQWVGVGSVSGITAALLLTRHFMLGFWLASCAVSALASAFTWALIEREPKARSRAGGWFAGLVGTAVVLGGGIGFLLALCDPISNLSLFVLPTADGGRISNLAYFERGFLDSGYKSSLYYAPPGWWARKEHIFDLAFGVEDTLRTAQRVEFYHDGDRKAFAIWSPHSGCLVAKRIMMEPVPWKGQARSPRVSQWVPAYPWKCFLRGFQPRDSATHEVLVAKNNNARNRKPEELVVDLRDGLECRVLGEWCVDRVDWQADRLYESAVDFPGGQPHTIVYSSSDYNDAWRFDLDATIAANPAAHPLPLPEGVTAVVTVVQLELPLGRLPEERSLEALVHQPNAHIICTTEGTVHQGTPTDLTCDDSTGAPTRFELTGLWGDPNPQLVAVAVIEPWGRRYLVVPFGWNMGVPWFDGRGRTLFFRLEQRSVNHKERVYSAASR